MRTALKRWGWAVGVAAAASLCVALRRRRVLTTNPGPAQRSLLTHADVSAGREPSPEPLPVRPLGANVGRRPSVSSTLAIAAASPAEDKPSPPAAITTTDIPPPLAPAMPRRRAATWIAALSLLAFALSCVYFGVALRKRSPSPAARAIGLTRAAEARAALRDEQRPLVSLLQAVPQPTTATGGGFAITLHNSGKGPASEVRIRDIIRIENTSEEPEFPSIETAPALNQGMLTPGAEFTTSVGFRTSPATMAELRAGKLRVVNYLLVSYQDMSRRSHSTQQCFYWFPGLQSPVACDTGNWEE